MKLTIKDVRHALRDMGKTVFNPAVWTRVLLPKDDTPAEPDTSRYLHVSVPMIPIKEKLAREVLGVNYLPGEPSTYNIGMNALKRQMDGVALDTSAPNKIRRRLRSAAKRRYVELMQGGVA